MNTTDVTGLLTSLLIDVGLPDVPVREPLRIWAHSGVERLRFSNGTSVVFKYADAPFDREHLALRLAAGHGLPVPHVHAARATAGVLAMLMDDLGTPVREAHDGDGASAAARLHQVGGTCSWLARVDTATLAAMPRQISIRLGRLGLTAVAELAQGLEAAAASRATGAELPPFGLCHSEFHPTSLHISNKGWYLLDLARAFTGPGLLDLASWHGTQEDPDPARTLSLIESYVAHGGHEHALAMRGGLDASSWALGWHRIWVVDWFAQQFERGWAAGAEDIWTITITRHLAEAITLLNA